MNYFAGDLLFSYGRDIDSRVIECATWGPSHVGMIFWYEGPLDSGEFYRGPMIVESTTLCDLPCEIRGWKIQGVQAHRPEARAAAYNGTVYRAPIRWGCRFRRDQSEALTRVILDDYLGRKYDMEGAIESATTLLPFVKYPDVGTLFCSALCSLLLQDFNKANRENPKRVTPAALLRRVRRHATHGPLEKVKV